MKNIIKDILLFTTLVLYFIYILKNNIYISKTILNTYNIWLTKIIPSLLPTFIIIDIINNSNIPYIINKYLKINYIYPLSIISGSPSNAYILSSYNIDITKHLSLTKYTSLIFTYTYLKIIFNKKITFIIILSNIISNIILILYLKPSKLQIPKNNTFNLPKSINSSINTLIAILGSTLFFSTIPIHLIKNIYLKTFLYSITEITNYFNYISNINISINLKILFTIIALNTCGLCIETQINTIINNKNINKKKYLEYRIIHLILFLSITYILLISC